MCGIAGVIDSIEPPKRDLIEKMTRIMRHRGPDGEGYYLGGPVALGHRRLSIIDLSGGGQPLSNEDGTIWITFNGEIYNFQEIRAQLIACGHCFKTHSDTETIVHAYEEYGERCVDKLRGMFAFAIWDEVKRTLFLARDRLGKKPLYYALRSGTFWFASEIKAIIQDQRIPRTINHSSLAAYFTYHYIPFPDTIFQGINKLPPGHSMTVTISSSGFLTTKLNRYWDITYAPDYSLTEPEWCDALLEKLKDAVNIRLISEVPLGAFLSGGIDSSTVVALMSQLQSVPVKTFSIGFKEEDFSELQYARQIAKLFGTDHHEFVVEPDAIEVLPQLAWEFDEPFADASAVPTYYVSKLAREHVTVILSGDGGDETFAGYRRYEWAQRMCRYDWLPVALKKLLFGMPAAALPAGMKGKGLLEHLSKSAFERFAGMNTFSAAPYLQNLLSADTMAGIGNDAFLRLPDYSALEHFYDSCPSSDYLTRMQYAETKVYLAEDILTKVDRASMLCSLETRAPLLDHEVIELAARMPPSMKLKEVETKYILKKTMEGILPHDILYRKKMGFGVPLVHWFKKDLTEYAHDLLLSREAKDRGIFNSQYVDNVLASHKKGGRDLSARIWALLFFEQWCRNWL